MPAIKKILFPVDFSTRCIGAARYVEALAGRFQAELMLLHVVGDGVRTLAEELCPGKRAELGAFLAEELKYFNPIKECVVVDDGGDAAGKIIETARAWQPDLVMMPTLGVGQFRRLLLGSTTAKVLHDLECPVWTDIHAEDAPPLEDITCRRVLCAIGLGEPTNCAVNWAAYLAAEYQAELAIVHAVPAVEASAIARVWDGDFLATLFKDARKRVDEILTKSRVEAIVFIEAGEPGKVVDTVARDFDADLIVIGRHAEAGLAGHLRHNAYAILRGSPCPVLSV
jgi:nucleotide-binding universal stress UspA family protein